MNSTSVKAGFAGVMTVISGFVGGFDSLLYYLVIFLVVDYITGVLVAVTKKQLSSELGLKGIIKKVMQLFLVGIAATLDNILSTPDPYIRSAVIYFLLANEGISILENVAAAGVPVPGFLLKLLEQIKEKEVQK